MSKQLLNRKKSIDDNKVSWLNIQTIRFHPNAPKLMKLQYVCDPDAEWYIVDLAKSANQVELVKAQDEPRKLNINNVKDLQSLKPFIPPVFHNFYDSLKSDADNNAEVLPYDDELLYESEVESEVGEDIAPVSSSASKKRKRKTPRANKKEPQHIVACAAKESDSSDSTPLVALKQLGPGRTKRRRPLGDSSAKENTNPASTPLGHGRRKRRRPLSDSSAKENTNPASTPLRPGRTKRRRPSEGAQVIALGLIIIIIIIIIVII